MFKYAAILFVFLAGLIHLSIAPNHLSHAPAHGLTFLAIGATQVLWAIAYVRFSRVTILYWIGLGLSGGIVLLWVLTQLIMPPFAAEPEPIDIATIASKCAEITAFFALLIFARRYRIFGSPRQIIASAAVVTLAVGTGMFFAGHTAELLLPQLAHDHAGVAHAHSDDTPSTHAHDDMIHSGLDSDSDVLQVMEASAHPSDDDHVHDQTAEVSTGQVDSRPHEVTDSPAATNQTGITSATNHQHPASEPVQTDKAPLMEQEDAPEIAIDHHHDSSADHTAKAAIAGPENQSGAADEIAAPIASDHAHSNEANILEDHHSGNKIITGLEPEGNPALQTEASEDTIEGPSDETIQSTALSELVDQSQEQTAAAGSLVPDPGFGTGPSWQQMPQYQPGWGHPESGYPSIQNSPEQLQMFRNRWHSSAWSPKNR